MVRCGDNYSPQTIWWAPSIENEERKTRNNHIMGQTLNKKQKKKMLKKKEKKEKSEEKTLAALASGTFFVIMPLCIYGLPKSEQVPFPELKKSWHCQERGGFLYCNCRLSICISFG